MASVAKRRALPPAPPPAQSLFAASVRPDQWPAWILLQWEDSYLLRQWVDEVWRALRAADSESSREIMYPKDKSTGEQFIREATAPSMFSPTRLIVAHLAAPLDRLGKVAAMAVTLSSVADRTVVVMTQRLGTDTRDCAAQLRAAVPAGGRRALEFTIWKPSERELPQRVRGILAPHRIQCDEDTLSFWMDRVGSNLERIAAESSRIRSEFPDGTTVTSELLEDLFETPHLHDETIWQAVRAMLSGDHARAAVSVRTFIQASDIRWSSYEILSVLSCVHETAKAESEGRPVVDVFRRFKVLGKRRQKKVLELSKTPMAGRAAAPAGRLLSLEMSVRRSGTAAAKREALLSGLLSLYDAAEPVG